MPYWPRHRDRSSMGHPIHSLISGVDYDPHYDHDGPQYWGPDDWGTSYTSKTEESMDDCVTPRFRWMVRNSHIVNNDMSIVQTIHNPGVCSLNVRYDWHDAYNTYGRFERSGYMTTTEMGQTTHYYNNLGWNFDVFRALIPVPDIDEESLVNQCVTSVYAKVSQAEYLSGVAVAEAHQTIRLFADLLARGIRILRGVRKLKLGDAIKSVKRDVKQTDKRWLTFRYGLRPIVYDIQQLGKAVSKHGLAPRTSIRSAKSADGLETYAGTDMYGPFGSLVNRGGTCERTVTASAGVLYKCNYTKIDYSQAFGTRIDDLLPSAWELVPYSFVVDWFCNIGDVITSWSPSTDAEVLGSWSKVINQKTTRLVFSNWRPRTNWSWGGYPYPDSFTWSGTDTIDTLTERSTVRLKNPDRPIIPSYNLRLDMKKLIDLLALAQQLR